MTTRHIELESFDSRRTVGLCGKRPAPRHWVHAYRLEDLMRTDNKHIRGCPTCIELYPLHKLSTLGI